MTGHQYGPHDPTTAPDAVVVGRPGRFLYPPWEVRPLPAEAVRQRAAINRLAHEAAAPRPRSAAEVAAALVHPNVRALGPHPLRHGTDHGRPRLAARRFRPGQPLTWRTRD